MLPIFLILCLSVFAHATPAFAASVWTCNEWTEYGTDTWGSNVNQAFSTDSSNFTIFICSSPLTLYEEYQVSIYDSNGKYLDTMTTTPDPGGSVFLMGDFSLIGDYKLQAGYADAVYGVPWNIKVYDLSNNFITSVPVYVNYNGYGGGGATLQSIDVSPEFIEMEVMGKQPTATTYWPTTQQLTVTANWSDGSSSDVTSKASYTGYDSTVVTVSSSGLVTAVSVGSTTVGVSYDGVTGDPYGNPANVYINVNPAKVKSISAAPSPITLYVGQNQQLTVTANLDNGSTKDITSGSNFSFSVDDYSDTDDGIATLSVPNNPVPKENSGEMLSTALDRLTSTGGGSGAFMPAISLGVPMWIGNGASLVAGEAKGTDQIQIAYVDYYYGGFYYATVPVTVEQAQTFTVTYYGNGNTGGSLPIDKTAYTAGAQVTVKDAGNMVRTNYTFIGWNTQEDDSGTNYKAGATFYIEADTMLYAVWGGGGGTESFPILSAKPSYFEQL
ncbi:MAG: InlB B-repeat-containing protein [Thermacetogeniaceae bacterium]